MPPSVQFGFRLYVLAMVLTPLAGAFDPAPTGEGAGAVAAPPLLMLVATVVPLMVAKALLIVAAYRQRNWARIALLILTGLGLGAYAPHLGHSILNHPLFGIANLALVIAEAVAIVLLFTPAASRWYQARKVAATPTP